MSPRSSRSLRELALFAPPLLCILLLALWARGLEAVYLLASVAALALAVVTAWRTPVLRGRLAHHLALGLAGAAVLAATWTEVRVRRVGEDWARIRAEREIRLRAGLDDRLDALLQRGTAAATRAAELAARSTGPDLFARLAALRHETDLAGLAVLGPTGQLVAWSGEHRGRLPDPVRLTRRGYAYAERPLFTYGYAVAPTADGGRAIAILLLETGPPLDADRREGEAARLQDATGATVHFGAGGDPAAAWSLVQGGDTTFHARIEPDGQAVVRQRLANLGRRVGLLLLGLSLVALTVAWGRLAHGRRRLAAPLLAASAVLALSPVSEVLALSQLFSPALYLLPTRMAPTLGGLLAILLPLVAVAITVRTPRFRPGRFAPALALGGAATVLALAGLTPFLLSGAGPPLMEDDAYLWGAFQAALVMALAAVIGLTMPRLARQAPEPAEPSPVAPTWYGWVVAGVLLSGALGMAMATWLVAPERQPVDGRLLAPAAVLWLAPWLLFVRGVARRRGARGRLLRTVCAGWLAATFALPAVWSTQVGARLAAAERALESLGSATDPYLAYLLDRLGEELLRRDRAGERGIDLLYRSWVASGLAEAGYPLQLLLWPPAGEPVSLHLAGAPDPQPFSQLETGTFEAALVEAQRTGARVLEMQPALPGVNQLLAVSLRDGAGVTAAAPPRRGLELTPALESFLGAPPTLEGRLTLVPAREPASAATAAHWQVTERGWRSEARVEFPEGAYHAHLELRMPPRGVRLARAVLLAVTDAGLLALLWALGAAVEGAWRRPTGWLGALKSFRGRVTAALFGFFLLPTAVFGTFTYRAFAGEAIRSARLLAERSVAEATEAFPTTNYLVALAERTGEEVLYYFGGELAEASSPEAVELGLYGGWMPPDVYLELQSGEELRASRVRDLSGSPYIMAFGAVQPAGTLAVPISLATGDAVTRQRELLHLLLFAALVGGVLSLWLSLYVARALARPIGMLRRAAAAVGDGRLDVRLPERRPDEFGELFGSFNRMVRRLRRARSREIRTARILAWGEMARQVAHEIKNPLTPIRLSVQHIRRAYKDRRGDFEEILDANVEGVLGEIDRLSEIARAFSRYGAPAEAAGPLERLEVEPVVRETLALYRAGDSGIAYEDHVEPGLPRVAARRDELKEVLVNLLENARAAVGERGTIRVTANAEDGFVTVCVEDDGTGIPEASLPRIFEPHFSTRTSGTGLGLAIVRRLVEGWGGDVSAESEAGRGTTVRVRLTPAEREQRPEPR